MSFTVTAFPRNAVIKCDTLVPWIQFTELEFQSIEITWNIHYRIISVEIMSYSNGSFYLVNVYRFGTDIRCVGKITKMEKFQSQENEGNNSFQIIYLQNII